MSSVVFGEKLKMALQDLHRKINDRELLLSQDNVQYEDLDEQIREAKVDLQQCIPDLDREVATASTYICWKPCHQLLQLFATQVLQIVSEPPVGKSLNADL